MAHSKTFVLPTSIISSIDVARLEREVESVRGFLEQAERRKAGERTALPKMSRMLEEIAEENAVNLLHVDQLQKLEDILKTLKVQAPVIHLSFAAEPTSAFLQKLVSWFRKEVHPLTLLQVGLQPSIAAGCIVRTTNKYFDFSLRQYLTGSKQQLIELMEGGK